MKINSYNDWRTQATSMYAKAWALGLHHQVAEIMGWDAPNYNPEHKKQELLKMAQRGEAKPSVAAHRLGHSLKAYINPSRRNYDPKLTEHLKKIRPDWFNSQTATANKKKQELLKLAKSGQKRPIARSWVGRGLIKYTLKSQNTYDHNFTKQIKKLRPDWFQKKKDS
jgi:hypothetical protein